jgi:hypothetical protein
VSASLLLGIFQSQLFLLFSIKAHPPKDLKIKIDTCQRSMGSNATLVGSNATLVGQRLVVQAWLHAIVFVRIFTKKG